MSTDAHNDLASFHQFVAAQLSGGQSQLSPKEALEAWRLQNRTPGEMAEDVQALREALADMEAGEIGTPWEEFDRESRRRHHLD